MEGIPPRLCKYGYYSGEIVKTIVDCCSAGNLCSGRSGQNIICRERSAGANENVTRTGPGGPRLDVGTEKEMCGVGGAQTRPHTYSRFALSEYLYTSSTDMIGLNCPAYPYSEGDIYKGCTRITRI